MPAALTRSRRLWLALGASTVALVLSGCSGFEDIRRLGNINQLYDQVKPGMSEKRVVELLGQPSKRMSVNGGETRGNTVRVFRWIVHNHIITITMNDGAVVAKQKI